MKYELTGAAADAPNEGTSVALKTTIPRVIALANRVVTDTHYSLPARIYRRLR
jgi:hypothetical protein